MVLHTSVNGEQDIPAVTMLRDFWPIEAKLENTIRLRVYYLQSRASKVKGLGAKESVVRQQELEVPLEQEWTEEELLRPPLVNLGEEPQRMFLVKGALHQTREDLDQEELELLPQPPLVNSDLVFKSLAFSNWETST